MLLARVGAHPLHDADADACVQAGLARHRDPLGGVLVQLHATSPARDRALHRIALRVQPDSTSCPCRKRSCANHGATTPASCGVVQHVRPVDSPQHLPGVEEMVARQFCQQYPGQPCGIV